MDGRFRLEGLGESARIVDAYDAATDKLAFDSAGRFWKAIERAHGLGVCGYGRKVAIIDTMCDLTIPRLKRQVGHITDSAMTASLGRDKLSHGTAVALLIAHVAPECHFDIYSILDKDGAPDIDLAKRGLEEAARSDTYVINVSAGRERDFRPSLKSADQSQIRAMFDNPHRWFASVSPDEPDCPLCGAAKNAVGGGKLVFAAAGNDSHVICCPARTEGVIAVGFQQMTRSVVTFPDGTTGEVASSGGTDNESLTFDLAIDEINGVLGTSFASPLYAGVAALGISAEELQAYLVSTRFGALAMALHMQLRTGGGDSQTAKATKQLYDHSLASLPHVHCATQARLRPNIPLSDPAKCWSCGVFAEDKYVNAGLFYAEIQQLAEAESLLTAARQLTPWSYDAAANLGATYNGMGRLRQALACYDDALNLRPGFEVYVAARDRIRQRMNTNGDN